MVDEIFTRGTVLVEISRKYFREGVDEKTVDTRLKTIASISIIAQINTAIA